MRSNVALRRLVSLMSLLLLSYLLRMASSPSKRDADFPSETKLKPRGDRIAVRNAVVADVKAMRTVVVPIECAVPADVF